MSSTSNRVGYLDYAAATVGSVVAHSVARRLRPARLASRSEVKFARFVGFRGRPDAPDTDAKSRWVTVGDEPLVVENEADASGFVDAEEFLEQAGGAHCRSGFDGCFITSTLDGKARPAARRSLGPRIAARVMLFRWCSGVKLKPRAGARARLRGEYDAVAVPEERRCQGRAKQSTPGSLACQPLGSGTGTGNGAADSGQALPVGMAGPPVSVVACSLGVLRGQINRTFSRIRTDDSHDERPESLRPRVLRRGGSSTSAARSSRRTSSTWTSARSSPTPWGVPRLPCRGHPVRRARHGLRQPVPRQ